MAIKILTKNSIDNTNIDGARQNHFSAGMKSGIVKGSFNEGGFFASATNIIALDTCELRISGHRVVIDSVQYFTLSNRPSNSTKYSMIAEISVNDNSEPTFRLFIQQSNIQLIKDNLFNTNIGSGTYQLEIGTFILSSSGNISNVLKRAKMITGGSDVINVGTITTTTLEPNQEANVNVSSGTDDEENHVLNFEFEIPKGVKGDKGDRGEQGVKGDNGVASGVVLSNTYDNSDENGYTKRAVNNLISNPNLLINGNFKINQRGSSEYSGTNIYTVDRWRLSGTGSVSVVSDGVKFTANGSWTGIRQYIENPSMLSNKKVVISFEVTGSVGIWANIIVNGTTVASVYNTKTEKQKLSFTHTFGELEDSDVVFIRFTTREAGDWFVLNWVKMEFGKVATQFEARSYGEELMLCKRFYQEIYDMTFAPSAYYASPTRLIFPVEMRTTPTVKTYPANINGVQTSNTEKTLYDINTNSETTVGQNGGYATTKQLAIVGAGLLTANNRYGYIVKLDAEIY